jgi:hypothetical protein
LNIANSDFLTNAFIIAKSIACRSSTAATAIVNSIAAATAVTVADEDCSRDYFIVATNLFLDLQADPVTLAYFYLRESGCQKNIAYSAVVNSSRFSYVTKLSHSSMSEVFSLVAMFAFCLLTNPTNLH